MAAIVHRDAHAPEVLLRLARYERGAEAVGEPLGEVHDLDVVVVVQILFGETLVDHVALAPVGAQVALRLLERRVATVARSHHAEPAFSMMARLRAAAV